jgi:uncharacterized coiled-coil DUF342 family protein
MDGDQIHDLLKYCLVALNGLLGYLLRIFGRRIDAIDQKLQQSLEQKATILEKIAELGGEIKVVRQIADSSSHRIGELVEKDDKLSEGQTELVREVGSIKGELSRKGK